MGVGEGFLEEVTTEWCLGGQLGFQLWGVYGKERGEMVLRQGRAQRDKTALPPSLSVSTSDSCLGEGLFHRVSDESKPGKLST